jgi:methionine sulfoxide reductase heme-binding subunit
MTIAAALGPSAYWYLARGTGAISLVLLTAAVVLGVIGSMRISFAPRWPRFAIDTLHRDVSLTVIVLLVLHIVTSVLDGFAPISLLDSVIPLISKYRPLWLGLGALSFDLLLALAATSLLRRRLGYQAWRGIHWLAYLSWPVAVLHGLGTGSDTKSLWMLVLTALCVLAVLIAVWMRLAAARGAPASVRVPALLASVAAPLGILIFTVAGPLESGWARRAGTPASLLPKPVARVAAVTSPGSSPAARPAVDTLKLPFSAALSGSVTQTQEPQGAIIDLALNVSGGAQGRLRVRMAGAPAVGGGLSMTGSQVDLTAVGLASALQGRILSLQGQQFLARVRDASGSVVDLQANLNIDGQSGTVSGTLSASRASGGGP